VSLPLTSVLVFEMDIALDTSQNASDPDTTMAEATAADGSASGGGRNELDRYADEFADLVRQYPPSRTDAPADWLGRLPVEAYTYYSRGVATFGGSAQTSDQRRGRLYLLHTALVFMWMQWGKQGARERLASQTQKGARRAAYLTTLEVYRRGGVVANYEASDWFAAPVDDWSITLVSGAVTTEAVEDDALRASFEQETVVQTDMTVLAALRTAGAIPRRTELELG